MNRNILKITLYLENNKLEVFAKKFKSFKLFFFELQKKN